MQNTLTISATICLFLASHAAAACDYPTRAKIVNGATASKEEMIESQKSVKAYMAAMEDYLSCIDAEEKATVAELDSPDEALLLERHEKFTKKHNAAVEEMEIVAAEFNEQVRAYKAQSEE